MQTEQDKIKKILGDLSDRKRAKLKKKMDNISPFAGHENVHMDKDMRAIMSEEVSTQMKEIFDILKLDYKNDPNLKDTPMRLASMWVNELMIGRYQEKPRMESFPLQFDNLSSDLGEVYENNSGMIISKKIDIQSLCSHHLMPFFNGEDGFGLIAYKPVDKLLGISKLQRLIKWYGFRPQLQEQLTYQIFKEICDTIGTNNVLVVMKNIEHTCESLRGVQSVCGRTSTIQYGGCFEDSSLRKEIMMMS